MRLNRLELIRYGRFKDADIVFPVPANGAPDVTVIFGPNEAGKSTAFNAYLELLFGFKSGKHPFAFRFDRADLLVGAELELPGRKTTILRRNSKRTQSLLDANERPLNEAVLSGPLHGLTSDTYKERFSLNETGLREGGERIASAQGDLGQLLHAGLSGLTGMAETLDILSERSELFYKKGGRGNMLKKGTVRLKEIRKVLRTEPLTPDRERSLKQACLKASKRFEAEDGELNKLRDRQAAAKAAQIWYEQTQIVEELENTLTDLPDGPDLAHDAAENVASLVATIVSDMKQSKDETAEIKKQEQDINDNPVDELAHPLEAELARLDLLSIDGTPVMDRAATAQSDYVRLSEERKSLSEQIDSVLQHLQVSDTAASMTALVSVDLDVLDEAARTCLTVKNSMETAKQVVDTARIQSGEAPEEPKDLTELRAAFSVWDKVKDLSILEAEQSRCSSRLNTVTSSLPAKWKDLVADGIPARETIDDVVQSWSTQSAEHEIAQKALDTFSADLARAKAELAAMESAPDAVDIGAIEESRRKRDQNWQLHRADMSIETADQFEEAMYADDNNRAHFLTGAEARQRLDEAQRKVRTSQDRHEAENSSFVKSHAKYEKLSERCKALASKLGLEEDASPSSFSQRQQDLESAAKAVAELANARDALNSQLDRQNTAREVLTDVAGRLDIEMTEKDQFVQVERLLYLENNQRKTWEKWLQDAKEVARLDEKLEQCRLSHAKEQARFEQLTIALPLTDCSPEKIQAGLPQLRRIQKLHSDSQDLSDQIETFVKVTTALSDTAKRLSQIMGSTKDNGLEPLLVIDSARKRLSASRRADEKRADAISRRERADEKNRVLSAELVDAQMQLAALFDKQGYPDLEPSDRVKKLAERDRLRVSKTAAYSERKKARDKVDQILFSEELNRLPNDTRKAELEQELQDAQELRDTVRAAWIEAQRIYDEACDAAERSDLATEAATLLEGLRNDARQAAIARLGVLAARGALRRLAKERRSDMLRDVANAFVTMTTPAWKDVDVWSQTDGDKLVGVRHDGQTVPVENMSTGTMGQLYFALRLAGYRSFARDPGPLPMILDDIMETFDDTRARAALGLCGEIGKSGQAILFTHHAHLVDLARECIEGVAVVKIPE